MIFSKMIYIVFVASLGYFILSVLNYAFLVLIGSFEGKRITREEEDEDYSLAYFSTFKIPISIIVPARNEEDWISDCVKCLLSINYPEFEIIIVNDSSTDRTLEILTDLLKLKPSDAVYIKHYQDGMVRTILTSGLYPNVTVIDKTSGAKKAGSVNAGLNLARYDYICVVDADTILDKDALLKVMAYVEKDPDRIIGVGSYFGLVNGFKVKDGVVTDYSFSYNPIVACQNIEYLRTFIGNRLAWSRYNALPIVAGGFAVWRNSVLYELGGYSSEFTCEDMELTFRAHDYTIKNKEKGYRIIALPYCVGWTEGPSSVSSLILQRGRWQRVTNETVWKYKYMLCNPRYGFFAFLVMPYFLLYEVLGVFVELSSIIFVAIGWLTGILQLNIFLAYLSFMLLTQAFISMLSVLAFVEEQKLFKIRYIAYITLLCLTEFFWYRWIISAAKIKGTIDFLHGNRSPDQYARSKRT